MRSTVPASLDSDAMGPDEPSHPLRQLFAGRAPRGVPLVANPYVVWSGVVMERLSAAWGQAGRRLLIVDAADTSPPVLEVATLDLACGVEVIAPGVSYLAARGLPLRYVDTRGAATRLLDELRIAAPHADTLLVHAEAAELARIFKYRQVRPMLLAADDPDALKHAYAAWKLLVQRGGWLTADLLVAQATPERAAQLAATLNQCASQYMGATLTGWAAVDAMAAPNSIQEADVCRLAAAQLEFDELPFAPASPAALSRRRLSAAEALRAYGSQ